MISHKRVERAGKKVQVALLLEDLTQTELGRRLGLRLPHLNMVVNGRRKTRWIREAIARELNRPVDELFGEEAREASSPNRSR